MAEQREKALIELQEVIEDYCTHEEVVDVFNEYIDACGREEKFYPMERFSAVIIDKCNNSARELLSVLATDFSFGNEGFWIDGIIHSGSIKMYYRTIIKRDMNGFVEWVYDNGFQYKFGL